MIPLAATHLAAYENNTGSDTKDHKPSYFMFCSKLNGYLISIARFLFQRVGTFQAKDTDETAVYVMFSLHLAAFLILILAHFSFINHHDKRHS